MQDQNAPAVAIERNGHTEPGRMERGDGPGEIRFGEGPGLLRVHTLCRRPEECEGPDERTQSEAGDPPNSHRASATRTPINRLRPLSGP